MPTNTLLPVPSQSSPRVLAKIASAAPRRCASASATTLSAYDVVLAPAVGAFSLRVQGTTATSARRRPRLARRDGDQHRRALRRRARSRTAPAPPVTVIRSRAGPPASPPPSAASSSATASRSSSSGGGTSPSRSAERASRSRWRVSANGTPSRSAAVSKTPSPTVSPWSVTEHGGVRGLEQLSVQPDLHAGQPTDARPDQPLRP